MIGTKDGIRILFDEVFIIAVIFVSSFVLFSCHSYQQYDGLEETRRTSGTEQTQRKELLALSADSFIFDKDILTPRSEIRRDEVIIERKSYLCSYNKSLKCANWSAWYLPSNHTDGPYKRKDLRIPGTYKEDEESLEGRQLLTDWFDIVGYDHGHLCPSGDNKWNLDAMEQTFYLSNICVQNSDLNQKSWENLESKCRGWAKKFGGIYIISGPIFNHKSVRRIGNDLAVPEQFFKVILDIKSEKPKAIAFLYDNESPEEHDNIEKHVITVDEIEKVTHYNFFACLPDSIEIPIESYSDIKDWKIY